MVYVIVGSLDGGWKAGDTEMKGSIGSLAGLAAIQRNLYTLGRKKTKQTTKNTITWLGSSSAEKDAGKVLVDKLKNV